jgi:hypothetical protein
MRRIIRDHSDLFSHRQFPGKRPLHQPLKQALDRYSRRRLRIAEGFDKCEDMGELLPLLYEIL